MGFRRFIKGKDMFFPLQMTWVLICLVANWWWDIGWILTYVAIMAPVSLLVGINLALNARR